MALTYTLTSAKASRDITGTLADAMRAAIELERELQPAYGVSITCPDGRQFECIDERIAVSADAGGDTESGAAMLAGDTLVIAWQQGIRTPFADSGLTPD